MGEFNVAQRWPISRENASILYSPKNPKKEAAP
jgi:hypothetical protein